MKNAAKKGLSVLTKDLAVLERKIVETDSLALKLHADIQPKQLSQIIDLYIGYILDSL